MQRTIAYAVTAALIWTAAPNAVADVPPTEGSIVDENGDGCPESLYFDGAWHPAGPCTVYVPEVPVYDPLSMDNPMLEATVEAQPRKACKQRKAKARKRCVRRLRRLR